MRALLLSMASLGIGLWHYFQWQQQPVITLADPTIFVDNGQYYLYGTGSSAGFPVYQSKDLKRWHIPTSAKEGLALKKGESFGEAGFWAPQVFRHRGSYYMAYTADEQIAIAKGSSPAGPFRQHVLKPLSGEGKQIDPFIFFDTDGKIYLYHVRLKEGNRIYVAEMKPDLSDIIPGSARQCLYGDQPWENTAHTSWPVTEGPTVIKQKNIYYLIYSANDFRNKDYAVGYATSSSPTGPWKKFSGNPLISRGTLSHNGTGHGDLFLDKNGKYQYVFHTHQSREKISPRLTAITEMVFSDSLAAKSETFRFLQKSPVD
ncbi:glycoside hydrolase family 43 protein [Pedobacter sp. JY14-1]|uniref:glycoside hydrolase family 43 protein n=1 Tax=Pedobacter sp. JY14-1 TaxID=3034151 RepID=UPI0023E11A72|nr:glycoside hydrolase family 43 protein [Pedobacter sp. JY14-1]